MYIYVYPGAGVCDGEAVELAVERLGDGGADGGLADAGRADEAEDFACPQPQSAIYVSFSPRNSVVSSPIWTMESSNDSHGPWLSGTPSIALASTLVSTTLKHQRNSQSIL